MQPEPVNNAQSDRAESISLADYLNILQNDYASLVSKLNSNESWAYGFVALYFAFMASISAVAGLILAKIFEPVGGSYASVVLGIRFSINGLLAAIALIGLLLTVWAVYMLWEYERSTKLILKRLSQIEFSLSAHLARFGNQTFGFATSLVDLNRTGLWRTGTIAIVASVMFAFFIPWIILLFLAF